MKEPLRPRLLFSSPSEDFAKSVRRVGFVSAAVILTVFQIATGESASPHASDLIARTLLSAAPLALVGWFPARAGLTFNAVLSVCLLLPPDDARPAFMVLGSFLVAGEWIARRWYLEAIVVTLIVNLAQFATSISPKAEIPAVLLGSATALLLGWLLQQLGARHADLDSRHALAVRRAEEAEQRVRSALSIELHDSVAQDLTKLVMLSEDLATKATSEITREDLRALSRSAQDSSMNMRKLLNAGISGTHVEDSCASLEAPESLSDTLVTCREMLRARDLRLETEVQGVKASRVDDPSVELMANVLREASINVLKYATPSTVVSLVIEETRDGGVSLSMTNQVDPKHASSNLGISGGLGLPSIVERVGSAGGSVHFGEVNGVWVLSVSLPGVR